MSQSQPDTAPPPADLAGRIELYLDDAPMYGAHSDKAGGSCWELLREAMEELRELEATVFEWKSRCIQSDDILREMRADLDPPQSSTDTAPVACQHPHLGLATTRELLDEIRARIEMHATGGLDYRTVDGESFDTFSRSSTGTGDAP
jgi:hypothetical protein